MMAPSIESSSRGVLPVQQSSPVKCMSNMIADYLDYQKIQAANVDEPVATSSAIPTALSTPPSGSPTSTSASSSAAAWKAHQQRSSSRPHPSTSMPPLFKPLTISPQRRVSRYAELLNRPVASAREQELRDALLVGDLRDEGRKVAMVEMQAGVVLAGMYAERAQRQLQAADERKGKEKSGGKLKMGYGKAKWFTPDAFIPIEAAAKKGRKRERQRHAVVLAEWKKKNDQIRERNEAKKAEWELEKEQAKLVGRRPGWLKPKWKDWDPEVLLPRPKKSKSGEDDEDDESEDGEDDDGSDADWIPEVF
ncbi:centromere protein B [Favolaschia claudopus]|uniref:Centromere protein B n=1 Tax=Favolaschia claudopus TaxID=2862362 RepID=A0AAW0AEN3_9AGAR